MELTMIWQFGHKANLTMLLEDSKFESIGDNEIKSMDSATKELLHLLAPENGSYDFLRDPTLLTST